MCCSASSRAKWVSNDRNRAALRFARLLGNCATLVQNHDVLFRRRLSAGAIIAEKEIEEMGGKLTQALKYFETAMDNKESQ